MLTGKCPYSNVKRTLAHGINRGAAAGRRCPHIALGADRSLWRDSAGLPRHRWRYGRGVKPLALQIRTPSANRHMRIREIRTGGRRGGGIVILRASAPDTGRVSACADPRIEIVFHLGDDAMVTSLPACLPVRRGCPSACRSATKMSAPRPALASLRLTQAHAR